MLDLIYNDFLEEETKDTSSKLRKRKRNHNLFTALPHGKKSVLENGTKRQNKNISNSRVSRKVANKKSELTVVVRRLSGCVSYVLLRTLWMLQRAKKAGTEFISPLPNAFACSLCIYILLNVNRNYTLT